MKSVLVYKWYILGFLALPTITAIFLALPYVHLFGLDVFYYTLKPWGTQIFSNKQVLWSVIGIISAGIGVIAGLTARQEEKEKEKIGAINAFYEEIIGNINQIFTGEIERVYDTDGLQRIKDHFNASIKDFDAFRKIHELYNELNFYREVQLAIRWSIPTLVTERQFTTCNKFLEYFGENVNPADIITTHNAPYSGREWEQIRDEAIKIKNSQLNSWKIKLRTNFKKIFGLKNFR